MSNEEYSQTLLDDVSLKASQRNSPIFQSWTFKLFILNGPEKYSSKLQTFTATDLQLPESSVNEPLCRSNDYYRKCEKLDGLEVLLFNGENIFEMLQHLPLNKSSLAL